MDSEMEEIGNIHFKKKAVVCEAPETCPFCQAGIERKVIVPIYNPGVVPVNK